MKYNLAELMKDALDKNKDIFVGIVKRSNIDTSINLTGSSAEDYNPGVYFGIYKSFHGLIILKDDLKVYLYHGGPEGLDMQAKNKKLVRVDMGDETMIKDLSHLYKIDTEKSLSSLKVELESASNSFAEEYDVIYNALDGPNSNSFIKYVYEKVFGKMNNLPMFLIGINYFDEPSVSVEESEAKEKIQNGQKNLYKEFKKNVSSLTIEQQNKLVVESEELFKLGSYWHVRIICELYLETKNKNAANLINSVTIHEGKSFIEAHKKGTANNLLLKGPDYEGSYSIYTKYWLLSKYREEQGLDLIGSSVSAGIIKEVPRD